MHAFRTAVLSAIGVVWVVLLVSPRRRGAMARKLAQARRFVSRRRVDEEARNGSRAVEAWEDEGGAMRGPDVEHPPRADR